MSLTNFDPEEEELRALYQRLKHQDEAKASDFAQVLTRRRTFSRPRINRSVLGLATALLLIATLIMILREKAAKENFPASASIATWRSPTNFLLHSAGERFLNEIPELGKPLIPFNAKSNPEDL